MNAYILHTIRVASAAYCDSLPRLTQFVFFASFVPSIMITASRGAELSVALLNSAVTQYGGLRNDDVD